MVEIAGRKRLDICRDLVAVDHAGIGGAGRGCGNGLRSRYDALRWRGGAARRDNGAWRMACLARGAGRGLAGASGVLAMTFTSGRVTARSCANAPSAAAKAAKLAALSKTRRIMLSGDKLARAANPTLPRIRNPNPGRCCPIFGHRSCRVPCNPRVFQRNIWNVTRETHSAHSGVCADARGRLPGAMADSISAGLIIEWQLHRCPSC